MLFRGGKSLRSRPSFAGTGLLERMRSTTFALLGLTAAMGLGLVLTLSQQSWPLLPSAPIPGFSSGEGRVHEATRLEAVDAVAAAQPAPKLASGGAREEADGGSDRPSPDRSPSGVEESRQLVTTPSPTPAAPPSDDADGASPSEPAPVAAAPSASATVSNPSPPAPAPSTGSSASGPSPITASTNQGKSKPKSKPPKGKSRSYAPPPAPAPAPPPAKVKDEPAPAPVSEESAADPKAREKGNGNAYGHSKK